MKSISLPCLFLSIRSLSPNVFFRLAITLAFCFFFVFSSDFGLASTDSKATAFVLCKSQKNVRTIRILGDKADNCTITYSKNGAEEVVGANRSVQTCKSILKSIEGRLEEAKWTCRNVESAHLMTSAEASAVQ